MARIFASLISNICVYWSVIASFKYISLPFDLYNEHGLLL